MMQVHCWLQNNRQFGPLSSDCPSFSLSFNSPACPYRPMWYTWTGQKLLDFSQLSRIKRIVVELSTSAVVFMSEYHSVGGMLYRKQDCWLSSRRVSPTTVVRKACVAWFSVRTCVVLVETVDSTDDLHRRWRLDVDWLDRRRCCLSHPNNVAVFGRHGFSFEPAILSFFLR